MMPDGGINKERIVLNDISMWSGSEANYNNPEAATYLPQIRETTAAREKHGSTRGDVQTLCSVKPEMGGTYGSYQMLGNLDINYSYTKKAKKNSPQYNREEYL